MVNFDRIASKHPRALIAIERLLEDPEPDDRTKFRISKSTIDPFRGDFYMTFLESKTHGFRAQYCIYRDVEEVYIATFERVFITM